MKRVLLTGASGFVGRHCLPALLAQGYEVHAVAFPKHAPPAEPPEVRWHQADLLDESQVSVLLTRVQPTHLLHCAWYAVPGKYWTATENFRWVEAGKYLLQAFADHGGQRVVGVGSCAEYDWRDGHCSELATPLNPATTYGACKHAFQLFLTDFSKHAKLSAAWARLFFLYGPHEPAERLVASVIKSILQEQPTLCTHGRQIRDFLFVQDAADALVALLDSDVMGPVNIASGEAVSVADVVQMIADQLGRPDLVRLGALPASENEPPLLLADVARLRDEVGWSPRYDLASGIAETINWWKLQQQEQGASK
jgi:nucleoside-diphosphate-sugar epimerase